MLANLITYYPPSIIPASSWLVSSPNHDGKTSLFFPSFLSLSLLLSFSLSFYDTEMHFMCLANILTVVWLAWIIDRRRKPPAACLFVQDFE